MWWPAPSQATPGDATMMRIMWNLFFMIVMQWLPLFVYSFLSLFVWGLLCQISANIFSNMTTNERMNSDRYSHFRDSAGNFNNRCVLPVFVCASLPLLTRFVRFDRGCLNNLSEFFNWDE
jgi:hypothetical protein